MLATSIAAFCAYCHKIAQFLEKPWGPAYQAVILDRLPAAQELSKASASMQ
jgi:glutaredoxin